MKEAFFIFLGSFLTAGFTWFIEWRKSIAEQKLHLRDKREELYARCYEFLMCFNSLREKNELKIFPTEQVKQYNSIVRDMIFSSKKVNDKFFILANLIKNNNIKEKNIKKRDEIYRNKIVDFYDLMRKELGIKD